MPTFMIVIEADLISSTGGTHWWSKLYHLAFTWVPFWWSKMRQVVPTEMIKNKEFGTEAEDGRY